MSASLLTKPNFRSSALSPMLFDVQSDRNSALVIPAVATINQIGGFAVYEIPLHNLQVGDVITMTGMEDIDDDYNGAQTITGIFPLAIKTDKPFTVGGVTAGTGVRTNNNFRIKATVLKGKFEHNTFAGVSDHTGNARFTLANAPNNLVVGDKIAISNSTKTFSAINGITDNQGNVTYDIGAHGIPLNETLNVTGVTEDVGYNGVQHVVAVTATTVTTNKVFTSGSGATVGSVAYDVYDGEHTVAVIAGNDVTVLTPYTITVAGNFIEVEEISKKRQFEITENAIDLYRFNVAGSLNASLTFDVLFLLTGIALLSPFDPGSTTNYTVIFTEQFDDANGLLKDGHSVSSNIVRKASNVANQYKDPQDLDRYTTGLFPNVGLFLTDQPDRQKYASGDILQLAYFTGDDETQLNVLEKDSGGSIINITTTALVTTEVDRSIARIDTGVFLAATVEFQVVIGNAVNADITERRNFVLAKGCDERKPLFVFLNLRGGFDNYRFTGEVKDSIDTRRTEFERSLDKGFDLGDRGPGIAGIKGVPFKDAKTEFIGREQFAWLEQLITSPEVYVVETVDGSKELIPVVLTNTKTKLEEDSEIRQLRVKYKTPEIVINV